MLNDLDQYLCEITGYDKISFQPNRSERRASGGEEVQLSPLDLAVLKGNTLVCGSFVPIMRARVLHSVEYVQSRRTIDSILV